MAASSVRPDSLSLVGGAILLLWLVFFLDVGLRVHLGIDLVALGGLEPRTRHGLAGIVFAHVLHANLSHLVANTVGLMILGLASCWYSPRLTIWAVIASAFIAGVFTWSIGRPGAIHIGASGVLFGLLGFLIANGLFRRGCLPLMIAVPIALLYLGALPGMLPGEAAQAQQLSWQMHLGGFIGGVLASWLFREEKAGG